MNNKLSLLAILFVTFALISQTNALMTRKMMDKKMQSKSCTAGICVDEQTPEPLQLNLTTQCNKVDLTAQYNYTGIVRSGYLSVGKGGSALAFLFYGRADILDSNLLKTIPTIIWLNGGPGSSSQLGNFLELGPLLLKKKSVNVEMVRNQFSWANNYNILFVDQPVRTGLSYADTNFTGSFAKSLDEVANDFYYALNQLYNTMDGCFNSRNLDIPATASLFIFGQSYAGKYAPAIAKKITEQKLNNGFLKGLKGVAIGDGFTVPYDILSEVGNWAFHLSLLDYQERMRVETILLKSAKNNAQQNWNKMHDDFDNALDYIVQQAGDVNVYDIKIDGEYEEFLQPYFRDPHNMKLYGLNTGVVYDGQADDVYNNLYTDFMQPQVTRVEYLLAQNIPVLVYNGQDDLIVQTAGTMKWADKIRYANSDQFRKQLFSPWKLNNKMVGSVKSAGLLQLRIVNNAGHLVPMDCPEAALNLATTFVQKWK